jgi:DNA polymerase-3 subunit alpha
MSKIEEIVNRVKELGMDSAALTDHGVMYGAIEFYKQAREAGIKPVIGCELYLAPRTLHDKDSELDGDYRHLLAFAKDINGYRNLMKLVSISHLQGFYYKPRIDKNVLREHCQGLIVTSGCLSGEIPRAILAKKMDKARQLIQEYLEIFSKENFYLELQYHPEMEDQKFVNEQIKKLAKEFDLRMILTCDSHYPRPEDRDAHDVFLSIQTKSTVDDKERMSMKDADFSIKDPKLIWEDIKDDPDMVSAFENTVRLTEKCNLELELGTLLLPKFAVPEGISPDEYLRQLVYQGMEKRYSEVTEEIKKRVDYELSVIAAKGFAGYFLIVADFVNWGKDQGIVINCRGSAAGCVVSYCLGIIDIDPLKYGLIFERFLNPERSEQVDIDIDVQDDQRETMIRYIEGKYGKDQVAQVLTFGVMKARLAVRDVARALGFPYSLGDQISKLIPFNETIEGALEKISELRDLYETNNEARQVMDLARRFEGVVRHASTHAAGVVIAPGAITDYCPVQHAARDDNNTCTQYDMYAIADVGLVKIDLLGLANLTVIKNAGRIIKKVYNSDFDIEKIPLDDPKIFSLYSKGQTVGLFQVESSGMQRYLKELKPTCLEDIVAMIALYRPGPMELIPSYINRKHGRERIVYLHEKLKPIIGETYGIGVYQEQMMRIATDLAGYTMAQADKLRKAIGKKIKSLLDEQQAKIIDGMVKNGIEKKTAQAIWELFPPFARYGFNKSHAVSYALVSYKTAYLKVYYPNVFMAALLTSDFGNLDRIAIEITECYRMGIKIIPPNVNLSYAEFGVVPETGEIIFSLAAIKGIGVGVAEMVQEERKANGKFLSLTNFIERMSRSVINRKTMESLIKSGSLDEFGERNQLLSALDQILRYADNLSKSSGNGQIGLFASGSAPQAIKLPQVAPADKKQKLAWEKECLGLYLSDHPLNGYKGILAKLATPIASLTPMMSGKRVKIGGMIATCQKITTKTGKPMLFSRVEDHSNKRIEVVVFPNTLEKNPGIWKEDSVVVISGRIDASQGEVKVICESVEGVESV